MAIINVEGLEDVNLVKCNPLHLRITSNLPTSGQPINRLRLTVAGNPNVGDTLSFSWNDVTVTFTVKTAADDTGNTISRQGALTLAQYAELLAEEIARNYEVFSNFDVSWSDSAGTYFVYIDPKEQPELNFSFTDNLTNITTTTVVGTNSAYQPNPSIALLVQVYNQGSGAYEDPLAHILPILVETAAVEFNLQPDFNLRYHLPDPATIGAGGDVISACTDNWTKFKISYTDRKGSTPQANALQHDDTEYIAIYAGQAFRRQRERWWTFWKFNQKFLTDQPRPKTITLNQPEWLYWIGRNGTPALHLQVDVTYRDDTTGSFTMGEYTTEEGEIVAIKAGFTQLGLIYDPSNPIVHYTVALYNDSNVRQSEEFRFNLDADCLEWERFYLFGNSLAGCDSIRSTGKYQVSAEHEVQEGERIVTEDTLADSRGAFFQYNKRERLSLQGSVGYKSAAEILHLREMLMSEEVWEIDITNQRFIPLMVDTSTIRLVKDGEDLYTLQWRYRYAYEECAIDYVNGDRIFIAEEEIDDG